MNYISDLQLTLATSCEVTDKFQRRVYLTLANSESGGKIEPRGRFQVHLLSKRRQSFHIYALLTVCHLCTNHHQLKKVGNKKENVFNRPTEVDPAFVFYK